MENTNNLQLASISSRILAFLLDDLIVTIIIIIAFWDNISSINDNPEAMIYFIAQTLFIPLMLLKIIYQTFFVWYYGATIGKMVLKIRVIDANSWQKVTFFLSLLRAIGRVASQIFMYIGFLIAFFNEGKRTFHDFLGRTLVVKT